MQLPEEKLPCIRCLSSLEYDQELSLCGRGALFAGPPRLPFKDLQALQTDEFNGLDESHRLGFLERLGVRLDETGRLLLEVRAGHLRSLGIAHGGVVATLLDSVMGMQASRSSPPDHYVVTAQLNVNFIRPAFEGETLIASSQVRHSGRMTAVAQGELSTSEGALVATSSGTFVFVPHNARTRPNPDRIEPTS
jgi:uncharacterized protein (TIGR00369 family)